MIPKVIHCVWLSGDEKPELYRRCIESWKKHMPDYEIKEWSLKNLPDDILSHQFVAGALKARKWAYATDVIRLWALKTYGGVYLDMDVFVYKSFDPFLKERAFSCLEINPSELYESVRKDKKELLGIGIEAAVLGAEKNHPWIEDIFHYYDHLEFVNKPKYYCYYVMPRVVNRISKEKYGFVQMPIYQSLMGGVKIFPAETFSWIYNWKYLGREYSVENVEALGNDMPMRYACHLTLHSWWEGFDSKDSLIYKIKHFIYTQTGGKINRKSLRKFNFFRKKRNY